MTGVNGVFLWMCCAVAICILENMEADHHSFWTLLFIQLYPRFGAILHWKFPGKTSADLGTLSSLQCTKNRKIGGGNITLKGRLHSAIHSA